LFFSVYFRTVKVVQINQGKEKPAECFLPHGRHP